MIQIYRNNQPFFTIEGACSGSKMSRQLMDHHYIVLKFSTEEPVYFEIGDSVEIAEYGLFVLTSAYFPKYNEATEGYDYELQMDAYYMSWKNKICKYRPQYGANETSFKLTTSVSTHLNVVLSNLKALNYKYHNKDFSVDYTTYNKDAFDTEKRFLVEYSSISIIEALNTICETLDCEWWVDGSIIYLGYCEMNGQTTFEQGVNMLSMSQSESKSYFITRLYAFGSDKNIPSGYFSGADADVTTDGIATDYLMLPNKDVDEEGYYSKDGYIENVNVVKSDSQAIEGVVKFEDEYPKVSCSISAIKTYESTVENEDGTKATATFWQITSKESFVTSFEMSWIKKGLTLMIRFESGALSGMEFEVSFKIIDKVKYFEIVVNDTYGRPLPDTAMCPKIGDKFYLYNWDATKITETPLISEAQEALYVRAKNYYKKSMLDNSNFTCVLDSSKFFNHGTYNFHPLGEQVKLINPLFSDIDSDGKHYRNSRIIGMEINLDIPYDSPTYIVGEKAAYSRLGQLEDKVNTITVNGLQIGGALGGSGVYVIGLNDVTPETDSNVYSARRTRSAFLAKNREDVAQKEITFKEGLKVGVKKMGIDANGCAKLSEVVVDRVRDPYSTEENRTIVGAQGFELYMGKDGKSHLYIDYLTTRTKFFAASAEIRKVSYSGGTTLFSNAGSTIMKVAHILDDAGVTVGYKCYAAADDGTTRTANWWHVGMMALCQTFNVKAGETENLQNRYYWRLVVGTGQETLEDGKLYDYVILSNKRTFMGSEACVPVTSQKVIGADGKALVFGDVMIQVTTTGEKQSLAAVFEEQEGKTTDDGNNVIANRMFFGYEPSADGGEPDAPQPYDVIVQAGDQIQWNRFGNLIKLTTSTEDGSDNGNAPAIAMYHAMGAPYKTGDTVNPYQWKTLTSLDSPLLVLKNAKNFKFFTDDNPDNIIDPVTVTYDLVPSSEYIIRKPNSQTATPNDITFTLRKRTGNVTEDMKDGYLLTAYYTSDGFPQKQKKVITQLSDIGVSFYTLRTAYVVASAEESGEKLAKTDIILLSDGAKGEPGADGKDAVEFIVKNAPLVFDTDENGVVPTNAVKTATIEVYRAGKNITSEVKSVSEGNGHVGCRGIFIEKDNTVIKAKLPGYMILKDSALNVSVTSGYAVVIIVVGSTTYTQQVQFLVNVAKFTGAISADNKQLRTEYTEVTNRVGKVEKTVNGIPADVKTQAALQKYTSSIKQDARSISLMVSKEGLNTLRNCIVGSALRDGDPFESTSSLTAYATKIMEGGVGGSRYAHLEASNVPSNVTSYSGIRFTDVRVMPKTEYTFSFKARVQVDPGVFVCSFYGNTNGTKKLLQTVEYTRFSPSDWFEISRPFTAPSNCTSMEIELFFRGSGNVDICRAMMEEGTSSYGWSMSPYDKTAEGRLTEELKETGVDITVGKITAKADTFEVQDNRGNVTARITEDGFFTGSVYATNGYFDGLVRNLKRVITKENFYEYFEKDTYSGMSDAYNPIWEKIGSNFVIQSTPEDADGAAMYLQLALPTAYPITHPYTDGRYERAREVIGNTIIIRCENGNGITLYGTSRTAPNWDSGGVAGSPYTLKSGYVVYLTCKVKNTGDSSEESGYETIYWERVVRKALP